MAGAIGITCAETGRYSMFTASIGNLEKPAGTNLYMVAGSDREQGRNELVKAMLDGGDEWLLFLDDDQVFEEDLLLRLLEHEVDIVGALYLRRDLPFSPIAYEARIPHGKYVPIDLKDYEIDELVSVDIVGTGGMLVRRHVFEGMGEPWFKRGKLTEDMIFCNEARDRGFEIYCDLSAQMGHMTTTTVWPGRGQEGERAVRFDIAGQVNFITPLP